MIIMITIIVIVWALKREQNNENVFKGLKQPEKKPLFRLDSDAEQPKATPVPAKSEPFLVKSNIDYTKPIPLDSKEGFKITGTTIEFIGSIATVVVKVADLRPINT